MALFFVQNVTSPVVSAHRAGILVETGVSNLPEAARDEFLGSHPAAVDDVIEVIRVDVVAFKAVATLSFPSEPVTLPAVGS